MRKLRKRQEVKASNKPQEVVEELSPRKERLYIQKQRITEGMYPEDTEDIKKQNEQIDWENEDILYERTKEPMSKIKDILRDKYNLRV